MAKVVDVRIVKGLPVTVRLGGGMKMAGSIEDISVDPQGDMTLEVKGDEGGSVFIKLYTGINYDIKQED